MRIANAIVSYAVYLGQFFWPAGLAAFYPRPQSLPAWQVGVALFVLTAVSTSTVLAWRRHPALLVGWLWYLGILLPVIGLLPIGDHARADRYTYLPDIGLSIAVVWGARWAVDSLCGHWPARALVVRRGRHAASRELHGLRLATDLLLAEQRTVMDPCLGMHREERHRP